MNIIAYVEVAKPKTVLLLSFVALISGLIAYYEVNPTATGLNNLVLSTLAIIVGSMGANAITCYIDRDIDAIMYRTKRRPIPSGRINPPEKALYYGLALVIIASLLTIATRILWSLMWFVFGVLDNVIIYNAILKRRNPINIIAGAPAGGAPIMVTWSAVTGNVIDLVPLIMAALVVTWTPVHIWSLALRYEDDYKRAKVPMLPVVVTEKTAIRCISGTTISLVVYSTLLGILLNMPFIYYLLITPINLIMLFLGLKLLYKPLRTSAWKLFKFTSPYLTLQFIALIIGVMFK